MVQNLTWEGKEMSNDMAKNKVTLKDNSNA
jgi:hypothetical protein